MAKKKIYTFVDLFAGCGGLSEGFMQSGHFKSLAHVEWELPMVQTLRNRLVKKWGETASAAEKKVILFDIQRTEELLNGDWSAETKSLYEKDNAPQILNGLRMLTENFDFYAMTAHADVNPEAYIKENFQKTLGKVYHPFDNREGSDQQYFSLALRKPEKEENYAIRKKVMDENEATMFELKQAFYIAKCPLGVDPRTLPEDMLPRVEARPHDVIPKEFLTMHYLEKYPNDYIVVGGYNGVEQLNWVFSRQGGKRDDAYNVRLGGKDVHGSVVKSRNYVKHAKFAILYDFEKKAPTYTFRVKNTGEMTKEKMMETGYINPHQDRYFCYFFDEEITLGEFDIEAIVKADMEKPGYVEGRPIYLSGKELIKFRK